MLALWSREDEDRRRVREHLPEGREVRAAGSWEEFRRLYAQADCALVVAPDPEPDLFARLQTLQRNPSDPPVVLVTRRDPSSLRKLKDVMLEEVVWTDALEEELAAAVRRADGERWFRRLESELEAASDLSPTLVAALTRALRRRPPLTAVQDLAGEVERDRRTLWHHWRKVIGEEDDLTLKGFLDWVLLLRAAARKTPDRSWREVAEELGVHVRTLRRVARRQCDSSLQGLSNGSRDAFFAAFEERVMAPLLAGERSGGRTEGNGKA